MVSNFSTIYMRNFTDTLDQWEQIPKTELTLSQEGNLIIVRENVIKKPLFEKIKKYFGFGNSGLFALTTQINDITERALSSLDENFSKIQPKSYSELEGGEQLLIKTAAFIYAWRDREIKRLEKRLYNPAMLISKIIYSIFNLINKIRNAKGSSTPMIKKWKKYDNSFPYYLLEKSYAIAETGGGHDKYVLKLTHDEEIAQVLIVNHKEKHKDVHFTVEGNKIVQHMYNGYFNWHPHLHAVFYQLGIRKIQREADCESQKIEDLSFIGERPKYVISVDEIKEYDSLARFVPDRYKKSFFSGKQLSDALQDLNQDVIAR